MTGRQPARWCAVGPDQQRSAVGDAHRAGGHRVESVDGERRQARRRGGRCVPAEPSRPAEQRQPWFEQVEGGDACGWQPQVRDAPAEVGGQFLVHAAPTPGRPPSTGSATGGCSRTLPGRRPFCASSGPPWPDPDRPEAGWCASGLRRFPGAAVVAAVTSNRDLAAPQGREAGRAGRCRVAVSPSNREGDDERPVRRRRSRLGR